MILWVGWVVVLPVWADSSGVGWFRIPSPTSWRLGWGIAQLRQSISAPHGLDPPADKSGFLHLVISREQRAEKKREAQCTILYKSWLASALLISRWPEQVTWSSLDSKVGEKSFAFWWEILQNHIAGMGKIYVYLASSHRSGTTKSWKYFVMQENSSLTWAKVVKRCIKRWHTQYKQYKSAYTSCKDKWLLEPCYVAHIFDKQA